MGDKQQLNNVLEKISLDGPGNTKLVRDFLKKNGKDLGLPIAEANQSIYDEVFLAVGHEKNDKKLENDEFETLVKEILEKFADELEVNPVLDI